MSLDAQICDLLAKMSVLSEVAAATTGDIVHGGEQSGAPRGPKLSMADEFRARYNGAYSDRGRREVIEAAQLAYDRAKRMRLPKGKEPEFGSPLWKFWAAQQPDALEVVRRFGVSRQYMARLREQYG